MSNIEERKIELVKSLLKKLHEGVKPEELSREFSEVLKQVSPFEVVLIEQQLIKEGFRVDDILKLCDLHVQLFREYLISRELKGVPEGHPLDLLLRENELILKWSELLGVYAGAALKTTGEDLVRILNQLAGVVENLRNLRLHYRKIQMLVFPYLEKRGIIAVPRVLWGREDQVLQKVRELKKLVEEARVKSELVSEVASKALELSREVSELVFRENKILFPAVWVLLTEGEWAAIGEISEEMGYLVPVTKEWKPSARPVMPYEIVPEVTKEQVDALPPEFRELALKKLEADTYDVRVGSDIELSTGFLSKKELEGILKSLPLELTYADMNDRVKFFTESKLSRGFVRTKTILGRRLLYCHPPRLEGMVRVNVERLKKGEEYREYWTKQGDRIIRVLVVAVRSESGEYLGTLEIVEDLTEVVKNPDEVMKKLVVL
ncbi:MAG: DUF438 domain-containing protein [Zestosphaera sp.]